MTINQVSFMSCAEAGTSSAVESDPLASPFYHFRFGAYNNVGINPASTLPGSAALISGLQPVFMTIPGSNVGGLSYTNTTLSYLNPNGKGILPSQFQAYLDHNPYSNASQPVVAVIYPNGARSVALAPTYASTTNSTSGTAEAMTLLQPLNGSEMSTQLVNTDPNSAGIYPPISYFENVGGPAGTLAGSLSFPVDNMASLGQSLNQVLLFFGYSNVAAGSAGSSSALIQGLLSPDNDPTKRLFGTGLQMSFTTPNSNNPSYFFTEGGPLHTGVLATAANGSITYPINNQVKEYDLNPTTGIQAVDLTVQNSELWDCYHLDIVRDIDRKFWVTTAVQGTASTTSATTSTTTWPQVYYPTVATPLISFDLTTGMPCSPTPPTETSTTSTTTNQTVNYYQTPAPNNCVSVPVGYPIPRNLVDKTSLQLQAYYFGAATDIYYNSGYVTGSVQNIEFLTQAMYGTSHYLPPVLSPQPLSVNSINNVNPLASFYAGTTVACPPDDPTQLTPAQLDRLRIAQRFLPADQWEINITHNCAVPLPTALSSVSKCYANGDADPTKLIQYSASPTSLTTPGLSTLCGPGQPGECPATVSFCVRYQ